MNLSKKYWGPKGRAALVGRGQTFRTELQTGSLRLWFLWSSKITEILIIHPVEPKADMAPSKN